MEVGPALEDICDDKADDGAFVKVLLLYDVVGAYVCDSMVFDIENHNKKIIFNRNCIFRIFALNQSISIGKFNIMMNSNRRNEFQTKIFNGEDLFNL